MSGEQVGVRSGDRAIERSRPESTCRLPLGTVLFAVTLLFGIAGSASPVSAQAPAAAQPGVQPGGTAALPVAVARQTGQYPNSPFPFARGDDQGGSNVGFYFSLGKLVPVLLLFFGWIWMCNWVNEDSKGLKLDAPVWNTGVLLGGLAGFGAVLTFPAFFLGFLALLVVGGGPSAWYLYTRNQHVPESARLLTPRHIQTLLIRLMSRLGINLAPSKEARDKALGPPIRFIGKSASGKGEDETRARQAEKSRGFMAARELVYDAILRRSTDVHLEPKQDELSVRYRIDGSMQLGEPFDRAIGDAIINIFKVLSAMDITEKRKPQDGSFRAELEGRMIDFRVASAGTRDGEKISMRILDQSNSVSKLAQLGMRKQMQEKLVEIVHMPHGMLLCCGPTGAGKSTSLYAMINELDSYQSNIITVEDPVEYKMKNVTQIEINTKAGQTFAGTLRSILRQDPDVVMIGEIRDEETARICCQAANTGHMVFSTVHANDSLSALYRLMDLGIEPFLLSSSLSGILSQRLVRKLCDDCKEAYKPKAELLEQIGLTPDRVQTMYRPPTQPEQTCPTCSGSGYRGRVGVYELFEITERIRDMVRDGASMTDIRGEARKNGMIYLKEEALRLVVKGITSMQEVNATIK